MTVDGMKGVYDIRWNFGHFDLYRDGEFLESCTNEDEAYASIRDYENERTPFMNDIIDEFEEKKRGRPKKNKDERMEQRFPLRLNEKQREQLKILAAREHTSESAMLRKLIEKAFRA